ncbi:uncharacterized protein BDR25DRAFT_396908 [Lindgomyces ingoldianus]|uniref:Uncharacterized protein n=1 Tax=Lindgomyces ingoldianus TaxID=673940 RepID=A0ACB6QAF3_9PLEO|nr:uncharacterized protein BDR25DRAFT_396908 [Lindgomyces ingoldianus]KAF2464009.1 hypothetical protein BDR25DRAFT_396908 [Lindgomyces ingoldianus]
MRNWIKCISRGVVCSNHTIVGCVVTMVACVVTMIGCVVIIVVYVVTMICCQDSPTHFAFPHVSGASHSFTGVLYAYDYGADASNHRVTTHPTIV